MDLTQELGDAQKNKSAYTEKYIEKDWDDLLELINKRQKAYSPPVFGGYRY